MTVASCFTRFPFNDLAKSSAHFGSNCKIEALTENIHVSDFKRREKRRHEKRREEKSKVKRCAHYQEQLRKSICQLVKG